MTDVPERIVIPHDEHHGRLVGRTSQGLQFFVTTPFTWGRQSREFLALYLFDEEGDLVDAQIDDLGTRADLVGAAAARVLPANVAPTNEPVEERITERLEALGPVTYEDIAVKPFELERHGVQFGLIPRLSDDEDPPAGRCVYVVLEPGDYMAFTPPWTGEYDT